MRRHAKREFCAEDPSVRLWRGHAALSCTCINTLRPSRDVTGHAKVDRLAEVVVVYTCCTMYIPPMRGTPSMWAIWTFTPSLCVAFRNIHLKVVVIRASDNHIVDFEHHAAELCGEQELLTLGDQRIDDEVFLHVI